MILQQGNGQKKTNWIWKLQQILDIFTEKISSNEPQNCIAQI
jgi:hypothetical protein